VPGSCQDTINLGTLTRAAKKAPFGLGRERPRQGRHARQSGRGGEK
jgi:hypothetical protein